MARPYVGVGTSTCGDLCSDGACTESMTCDINDQDTCAGMTCDLGPEGATCRPTGAGQAGDACDGAMDCDVGLTCSGHGVCKQYCVDDVDCSVSEGDECVYFLDSHGPSGAGYCSVSCSPFTGAGCPTDFTCVYLFSVNATECVFTGQLTQGQACETELDSPVYGQRILAQGVNCGVCY